jgi:hypothetical protein
MYTSVMPSQGMEVAYGPFGERKQVAKLNNLNPGNDMRAALSQ